MLVIGGGPMAHLSSGDIERLRRSEEERKKTRLERAMYNVLRSSFLEDRGVPESLGALVKAWEDTEQVGWRFPFKLDDLGNYRNIYTGRFVPRQTVYVVCKNIAHYNQYGRSLIKDGSSKLLVF